MDKPVVLITGTSSGFGLMAAVTLSKNGYYVVASMRNMERDKMLRDAIYQEKLEDIEIVQLDVTDHKEVNRVVLEVISRLGHVDVLVNNAGYVEGGFVEHLSMEDYRKQFETNVFGVIAVTQAVLPYMRERGVGKIINISSVSGQIGFPIISAYVSSKFAIEGFSESLRLELLPFGVYVSLIEPGPFKTEIWSKHSEKETNMKESPYYDKLGAILHRVEKVAETAGNPQEVADLLLRVAKQNRPKLRYPIGKGIKRNIILKKLLPWEWLERQVMRLEKGR